MRFLVIQRASVMFGLQASGVPARVEVVVIDGPVAVEDLAEVEPDAMAGADPVCEIPQVEEPYGEDLDLRYDSAGRQPPVFAFMYSFLVGSESDGDRLAAEALALIEDAIAAGTQMPNGSALSTIPMADGGRLGSRAGGSGSTHPAGGPLKRSSRGAE